MTSTNLYWLTFKEKAEIFNSFFAEKCTLIITPANLPRHLKKKKTKTEKVTSSVHQYRLIAIILVI